MSSSSEQPDPEQPVARVEVAVAAAESDIAASDIEAVAGAASAPVRLEAATSIPARFAFGEVTGPLKAIVVPPPPPPLGPLAAFVGNWHGTGINTIFRPDNTETPSSETLPHPLPPSDNVLELNLTSETLSFSASLGHVPNRGRVQGDIFLNGVPYLQARQGTTCCGLRPTTGSHRHRRLTGAIRPNHKIEINTPLWAAHSPVVSLDAACVIHCAGK